MTQIDGNVDNNATNEVTIDMGIEVVNFLIDLALLTNDEAWFNELSNKINE